MALPLLPAGAAGGALGGLGAGLAGRLGGGAAARGLGSRISSFFAGTPLRAGLSGFAIGDLLPGDVLGGDDGLINEYLNVEHVVIAAVAIVLIMFVMQSMDSGPSPVAAIPGGST